MAPKPSPGSNFQSLLDALKSLLKSRGWTYRDVAERVGLSESGVKKMFTAKDFSLKRFTEILAALGVRISDLEKMALEEGIREVRLSPESQAYLLKNFDCFAFYWKLAVEGLAVEEIQKRDRLGKADVQRYLLALDRLGLIELHAGDRVRAARTHLVRWVGTGPLLDYLNDRWSKDVVERALKDKDGRAFHRLSVHFLTEASATEFRLALDRLIEEFSRRSERERVTKGKAALKAFGCVGAVAPMSFVEKVVPRQK